MGAYSRRQADKYASPDWRDRPVIVCDPNPFTRRLTLDMLRTAGAQRLSGSQHASSALWALKQSKAPILVADGRNADITQMVRKLRRLAGHQKQAPTVLIAGHVKAADVQHARDIGVDAIAARPLAPQTLFDRLDEIVARPRSFIDAPRYSGPDRRANRPADGEFKRQADVEAGLVSALTAARAEARAVIFERLRMRDPLAARVGRSLERFLEDQKELTDYSREIIALHRATLGKLVDHGDGDDATRLEIVTGLERLVSRRAA